MSPPLTGPDAAWYRMETPANPMVVTGLVEFAGRVDEGRLRRLVAEDLAGRYPRFRQRVTGSLRLRWSDDPDFDLDHHLKLWAWPGDLPALVGELAGTPLDRSRPLWSFTLVRGGPEGDVLVVRIAHCIADGVALARMILGLADAQPDLGPRPGRPRPSATAMAGLAARGLLTLPRLALLSRAPRGVLRGPLSGTKRVAWSEPFPLDAVRRPGGTVNDVLLDAVAGGLRRVLAECGQAPRDLRAAIPVDLRDPSDPGGLGNRFGLVFLDLPVGVATAEGRRSLLGRRMAALKSSPEAAVTYRTLGVLGRLPALLLRAAMCLLGSKVTLVLTNVPGPREPLALAGSAVRRLQFWVPQTGGAGLGVSILSYAGEVTVGVVADTAVLDDPGRLLAAIQAELGLERREQPHA